MKPVALRPMSEHSSDSPLIIFSHGNSFPATTYGVLFQSLRARGFQVAAIEKFGHDPRYPVTSNWPNLADNPSGGW